MMKNISDILIETIKEHYLTSPDHNGISATALTNKVLEITKVNQVISALVLDGYVGVLSDKVDDNPHINRLGFPNIERQLEELQNNINSCILYPTSKAFATEADYECINPMENLLKLGYPQLRFIYFEYDILLHYAIDPRIHFTFNDYSGSIVSSDETDKRRYINLKTFGIGRDGSKFVVAALPRDLRNMSPANQMLWEAHRIQNPINCKVLNNYLENELYGNWNFPQTVYRSILEEEKNINVLSEHIFGEKFFRETFNKSELYGFEMLPFPSRNLYNNFLLLLEKISVSNINEKFFDKLTGDATVENGKRISSLTCLSKWLDYVCPQGKDTICNPLKKVRKVRQGPAHKILSDNYEPGLLNEQHEMCASVYGSFNALRTLLTSHPRAKGLNLSLKDTQYIVI